MNINYVSRRGPFTLAATRTRLHLAVFCLAIVIAGLANTVTTAAAVPAFAQKTTTKGERVRSRKLPSPEKIVGDYLKAVGGKKRLTAFKDATYNWTVLLKGEPYGSAQTEIKAPAFARTKLSFGDGEIIYAANASSAWTRGTDGKLVTLTGAEGTSAKLRAGLDAGHLIDYKKLNVLARTVALDETLGEPAYVVEFSTRGGARLRYWFGASSNLLIKAAGEAGQVNMRFSDYRVRENNVLEPHRIERDVEGRGALTFVLERVSYNASLSENIFDPPRGAENIDIPALLREVGRNQQKLDERVNEYTFKQTVTERGISDRGELKKEEVKVYEIYPVQGRRRPVRKLVSENGVPLSGERAAKEEKRTVEEMLKAERDYEKEKQKRERAQEKKINEVGDEGEREPGIAEFLKVSELVSPRRESFRGRETVVFDFRPRPGFRPSNREEEIVSKLVGIVWVDPVDKQVMRLEARLAQGYKIGGGLVVSLRPGAAFVIEQTRLDDGVWLPRFAQANLSVKVFLFGGGDINTTLEWSDYKRFKTEAKDYKLDAPEGARQPNEAAPNPN